jgi:murein DD-endopeptidase MepM/ murein hydrolase activator NlpD
MLFGSGQKWWGDRGKRSSYHEGLDLFLYGSNSGQILRIDEKTEIPAIYGGTVVRVLDDFLGKSLFIEHGNGLITAFGHTRPLKGIKIGSRVKEGDLIATIAETSDPKTNILPHLHITAGWISGDLEHETLDWEIISNSEMIRLVDPLDIIGSASTPLESGSDICLDL